MRDNVKLSASLKEMPVGGEGAKENLRASRQRLFL
jgi:hypothetical protein